MKFINTINEKLKILNEEEPAPAPAPVEAPPVDVPPEPAETALPDQEESSDQEDTTKMKIDYVEMVRRALIMSPKHIDDIDYAKLTSIVDTENMEEMHELVSGIIRNNYPHPDL